MSHGIKGTIQIVPFTRDAFGGQLASMRQKPDLGGSRQTLRDARERATGRGIVHQPQAHPPVRTHQDGGTMEHLEP